MGGAAVASFLCDLFTLSTEPIKHTQYNNNNNSKMPCVNKQKFQLLQNFITKL